MKITVQVFGSLRELAGGSKKELKLPEGANVSDAIAASGLEDKVDLWVLQNGKRAGRKEEIKDGDVLTFFQPVGGG